MTKKLPAPLKREEPKQNDLFSAKGKIRTVVDFLNEHYIIHVSAQNPEMITVESKDSGRYTYPPTFSDIHLHIIEECQASISSSLLWEIISSRNYIKPFDPASNYLESIKDIYKGESHIDLLCTFLKATEFDSHKEGHCQARMNRLIRKWMVASIGQWKDNIPNPVMLTFIQQREGQGKTSLCDFLVPEKLKKYAVSLTQEQIKNMEDIYTRFQFVVHDELIGISKWTLNRWNHILSANKLFTKRRTDKYPIDRPRTGIALGTSNQNQKRGGFIRIGEEGRRYGCIELDEINWKGYMTAVDVDQMWAEALMLYEYPGYEKEFTDADFREIIAYNSRYATNISYMYASNLLEKPESEDEGVWMNPTEIIRDMIEKQILEKERLLMLDPVELGKALKSLGYWCENRRKCTAPEFKDKSSSYPLQRYLVKRKY